MLVFQYVIFYKNSETDAVTLLKDVTTVIEKTQDIVKMKAAREIPEEYLDKLEDVVIAVRSF